MKTTKEIFAGNFRNMVAKTGKNVKEVSDALSEPYTTVLSWHNKKNFPRDDKIDKLAAYFGVPVAAFFAEKE